MNTVIQEIITTATFDNDILAEKILYQSKDGSIDKEILAILKEDGRCTASKIAVMLGENEDVVSQRIKNMEDSGVIVRYTAIANPELIDDEVVEALIEVKVSPQKGQGFDGLAEQVSENKEVKGVYLMSGAYDLAVFVEGKSLRSISRFVSEKISTFDCVLSTATHFILKKYKIEGTVTKKQEESMRLFIQP